MEHNYLSDPDEVELIPGAVQGLRKMQAANLGIVVVTNQSGIGRGFFDEEGLELIHQKLLQILDRDGVRLDGIFFCPHLPTDGCNCRKPETGLLDRAAETLNFDARTSFVVGDKASDIEMGQRAGATTLLVRTGYGAEVERANTCTPDHVAGDLFEAGRIIHDCVIEKGGGSEDFD